MNPEILLENYQLVEQIIKRLCCKNFYSKSEILNDECFYYILNKLKMDKYDSTRGMSLKSYLYLVVNSRIIDFYRHNKNKKVVAFNEEFVYNSNIEDKKKDSYIDLEYAIKSLTSQEQVIIKNFYYYGLTIKEIAKTIDIDERNTSKIHRKALEKLKEMI